MDKEEISLMKIMPVLIILSMLCSGILIVSNEINANSTASIEPGTGEWSLTKTHDSHAGWVRELSWSNDGTMLAAGGNEKDNYVKIWDVTKDPWVLVNKMKGDTSWGTDSLDWSPDGTKLLSSSYDSHLRIWDTTSWDGLTIKGNGF